MVQMNLFTERQGTHRCREWTCRGAVGKEGGMDQRVSLTYTCHPVLNRQRVGSCCVSEGAHARASVMTQRGGWGWEREAQREGIHVFLQPIHVVVRQKPAAL